MRTFSIAGREIGPGKPCYVIAELSGNHNGDPDRALELVRAAAKAGADAVKLQTYTADTITINCDKPWFQVGEGTLWAGRTLHSLYEEAHTPWDWQPKLKVLAEELGMHCFSSPFDDTAVDFLETLDVPAYKVASFELVDIPLLKKMARTTKPMILSTGMATLSEIEEAVNAVRAEGVEDFALLKTNSAYPAPASEMNLQTIPHMAQAFGVPTGLSDHTLGISVPVAATALGATVIEKHMCLRRADGGPDAAFSLEPEEFKAMVEAVRTAEAALGSVVYSPTPKQEASKAFRRSLFAVEDIAEGEALTAKNVRSIRPSGGLHTRYFDDLMGRRATTKIERGTPLRWDLVD